MNKVRDIVKKESVRKILFWVMLVLITGLFAFSRIYRLDSLPYGINIDEVAASYSAHCLSYYGIDRYGYSYPIYFNNFWSGQSAMFLYLLASLFRFFPENILTVRLLVVAFSLIAYIFAICSSIVLYKNEKMAWVLTALLCAVCPAMIFTSRLGLDCYLALGMSAIVIFTTIKAIHSKKAVWYFVTGIFAGLSLYSYALMWLIIPLFLFFMFLIALNKKELTFKKAVVLILPLVVLAAPLMLYLIVNMFDLELAKIGCFSICKMETFRASEIGFTSFEKILVELKSIFIGDVLRHNSVPQYKNMYFLSIPLTVIGIIDSFIELIKTRKEKIISLKCVPLLWFASVFICLIHTWSNVNKTCAIFPATILLIVDGFVTVIKLLKKRKLIFAICCSYYFFCFLSFEKYYFTEYRTDTYPLTFFDIDVSEGIDFIREDSVLSQKETYTTHSPVYLAWFDLTSPYEYDGAEDSGVYMNFLCNGLPEVEQKYTYIVSDRFPEYMGELADADFAEKRFDGYSVFYYK